jgi:hypothetical protein
VQQPDGGLLLTGSALVAPGAHLVVSGGKAPLTRWLASDADGFVSIVAWGGQLDFSGTAGRRA